MVNYDPPNHHEDYVHRVGRTGRAGNKGTAITFIGPDEERYAPDLVKALRESGAPVPAVSLRTRNLQLTRAATAHAYSAHLPRTERLTAARRTLGLRYFRCSTAHIASAFPG